jgi:G:T-mismatch repair DNA endonuclease (very short patch repair protein)
MDILTPEKRAWNMSRIRGRDTRCGLEYLKGAA